MAEVTSKNKTTIIVVIVLIVIALIVGWTFWKHGTNAPAFILSKIISLLFWVVVLVAIGGIVYFLFFYERKIDVSFESYRQVLDECDVNKNEHLGDLWTRGDIDHRPKRYGKIIGWSHRQNFKVVRNINDDNKNEPYYENEDIFFVKVSRRKKIVVRVPESLHDELHGDVYINCCSLVKAGYYFFPNVKHLDFDAIDKTLHNEGIRFLNLDIISLIHPTIVKAVGLKRSEMESTEGQTGLEIIGEKKKELMGK